MGQSENIARSRGRVNQADGTVRVWSEVGLTLPVGDTTAHIRFLFGHERVAKNDSQAEITRTEKLIDEFNENVVAAKVRKYTRLIQAWESETVDQANEGVRTRARRKVRERHG